MRPISLSDEHMDEVDNDDRNHFEHAQGSGIGRRRHAHDDRELLSDLFDEYPDEDDPNYDETDEGIVDYE